MRDDERYPTVVFPEDQAALNAPEVVTLTHIDPRGYDKISPEPTPGSSSGLVPGSSAYSNKEVVSASQQKTYFGLRKKTFFIILGIVIAVVIAAIVGGVVGGLAASGNLGGSDDAPGTKEGNGDDESGSIDVSERFLTAARSPGNSDEQHIHIFYQNLEGSGLSYRHITDDESGTRWPVELDIDPIMGTPLAAVGLGTGRNTQLFYLSEGSSSDNVTIVEASLDCDGDDCSLISNKRVGGTESSGVYKNTKLAAFRWAEGEGDSVRVYYQSAGNDSESLWVVGGRSKEFATWTAEHLVSGASPGTGVAVCGENSSTINMYYIDADTKALRIFEYDDEKGPGSGKDEVVYQESTQPLNDTTSLAAVWLPEQAPLRIFFAEPNGDQISSYWRDHQNSRTKGEYQTANAPEWGHVEGGLAAVGWDAELRLYYFQDRELTYNARNPPDRWDRPQTVAS